MIIKNVRFSNFNNSNDYTTSTVQFTYKNKKYMATTLQSQNGFKVLSIAN